MKNMQRSGSILPPSAPATAPSQQRSPSAARSRTLLELGRVQPGGVAGGMLPECRRRCGAAAWEAW